MTAALRQFGIMTDPRSNRVTHRLVEDEDDFGAIEAEAEAYTLSDFESD